MREWGKRSFCLVCMFLVLTGMPVTVQAADYVIYRMNYLF